MDRSTQDIIIIIIAGTATILFLSTLLIVYIFFYQKRQNSFIEEKEELQSNFNKVLSETQNEVQESTMAHLARELHDNIGQLLSSTRILINITQKNLTTTPDTLKTADETLGKAISELRALSKSLSKEWLNQFQLIENLITEANRINAGNELNFILAAPKALPLDSERQIILFRIIQESIQNVVKHANANNLEVIVTNMPSHVSVKVIDDGKGFNADNINGLGITNMKQRTALLKGKISWKSNPGNGCTIEIEIPYNNLTA